MIRPFPVRRKDRTGVSLNFLKANRWVSQRLSVLRSNIIPMNPSAAGLAADYQVETAITKRVKKKTIKMLQPVSFTATYTSSDDSVTLTIEGRQKFAKGGQITVTASPPDGVSSATGILLDATDTVFAILAKATGITPR